MVFSLQRFIEDYFERRGLADVDQYAVRLANTFAQLPPDASERLVLRELRGLRTAFYRRNRQIERGAFQVELAATLRKRFKKKSHDASFASLKGAYPGARARLLARRRSMASLLTEFRRAVESRSVDVFWRSRKQGRLRSKPEKLAQGLFAVFVKGVLGSTGTVLREVSSGIGFVDVGVSFGGPMHLVELKILKAQFTGVSQLATYMETEGRNEGWLLLIDARPANRKSELSPKITTKSGSVRVLAVDINPAPPHMS